MLYNVFHTKHFQNRFGNIKKFGIQEISRILNIFWWVFVRMIGIGGKEGKGIGGYC